MLDADKSLSMIGAMLGHADPRTTQGYAHRHAEALRDALDAFDSPTKRKRNRDLNLKSRT
jgi:site-specific recombinase XerD